MSIVREVEFSKVHVFKYSKRKNTPAADRADQVDGNIKIKRSEELIKLQDQYLKKFREKNMPRTLKVLFEEFDQGYYFGYTDNYIRVKVKSDKDLINKILDVRLVDNKEVALGELV